MAPKLKLRLVSTSTPSDPRNSFTNTDYYRKTKTEIYSPISRIESLSPNSPTTSAYTIPPNLSSGRLSYVHEGSESDEGAANDGVIKKRTAGFWHFFNALFHKWRRHKDPNDNHKSQSRSDK